MISDWNFPRCRLRRSTALLMLLLTTLPVHAALSPAETADAMRVLKTKSYVFPLLLFKRISDVHDGNGTATPSPPIPGRRNLYGTPPQGRAEYAFQQN